MWTNGPAVMGSFHFPILTCNLVSRKEFVSFWSKQYIYPSENLYISSIKKPLTRTKILNLFIWKNGGILAWRKKESVLKNYIDCKFTLPHNPNTQQLKQFLLCPGGAIWRIFWLHCNFPETFPIYDQHVHRAMAKLKQWKNFEIPKTNALKVETYLKDYLPFWREFAAYDNRETDRALWAYGKFIKNGFVI